MFLHFGVCFTDVRKDCRVHIHLVCISRVMAYVILNRMLLIYLFTHLPLAAAHKYLGRMRLVKLVANILDYYNYVL
jgi:hypothetical protein